MEEKLVDLSIMKTVAYFISDAHLGINLPGNDERELILHQFLKEISPRAKHLFIVGDLFDFWIEYRHAIRPDYFNVIHSLRALVETGTEIHYCLGNHDFAIGKFIEKIGIRVHKTGFQGVIQGKRLRVTHGDELYGSQTLSRILRNPILQFIYKFLHPNIGIPLGEFFSGLSRKHFRTYASEEILEEYRQAAKTALLAGYDIFISGHTHCPELIMLDEGIYCNIGNWINLYSYAELSNGQIHLRQYNPGKGIVSRND